MKELQDIVLEWNRRQGEILALATLVRVQGSSYRRPGARMLICSGGKTVGSLSAGCLEDEVKLAALEVIRTGEPRLMHFDTRRRFGCNGSIEIFIERAAGELREQLTEALRKRAACTIEAVFENAGGFRGTQVIAADAPPSKDAFVQKIEPLLRVVLIGDGPEITALRALTGSLGWELFVFESVRSWNLEADGRTAVIIATHNYGNDCAALRHFLPLGLNYVGVVGPRRRRDELMLDVLDSGITISSELFAPAGLHLGADGPAEIALSIIAEIQAVFARASRISLRDRKAPIHEPPSSLRAVIAKQ